MLSYQHAYHAGNAADVHKHALLAWALAYMTGKDKPLTYFETHAGRALYDLASAEAQKTGEASAGIAKMEAWFPDDHPYARTLHSIRKKHGANAYPGSPLIASEILRQSDRIILAERHPQEVAALRNALPSADIRATDGPEMALAIAPPTPRRGLVLIDPSYEVKEDFERTKTLVEKLRRKWPVGVIMVWYPILTSGAERPLALGLPVQDEGAFVSEVRFPKARPNHGMIGSGLWVANPPWGFAEEAGRIETRFAALERASGEVR